MIQNQVWPVNFHPGKLDLGLLKILKLYTGTSEHRLINHSLSI